MVTLHLKLRAPYFYPTDLQRRKKLIYSTQIQVLQKTGWRIEGETGAAVILGLNPSTLRGRMRKYGIRR